jgi:hypothetical protein
VGAKENGMPWMMDPFPRPKRCNLKMDGSPLSDRQIEKTHFSTEGAVCGVSRPCLSFDVSS